MIESFESATNTEESLQRKMGVLERFMLLTQVKVEPWEEAPQSRPCEVMDVEEPER